MIEVWGFLYFAGWHADKTDSLKRNADLYGIFLLLYWLFCHLDGGEITLVDRQRFTQSCHPDGGRISASSSAKIGI